MSDLRILIADDHAAVRHGIRSLLSSHDGWEVLAEAADGLEAVEKTEQLHPDVVLLDIAMPNLNGIQAARKILNHDPQAKVLIITVHANKHVANEAMHLGASGFLSKTDAVRDLIRAVETVEGGGRFFPMLEPEIHERKDGDKLKYLAWSRTGND